MIKLLLVVLLSLLSFNINSQHFSDYNVRKYNNERELDQNFIYDIIQSKKGHLKIASEEGIFTYNGVSFLKDKLKPKSIITSLSYNKNDVLYAGSLNGEIYKPEITNKYAIKSEGRIDNLTSVDSSFLLLEEHQNIVHINSISKKVIYSAKSFIYELNENQNNLCFIDNDSLINIAINKNNELKLTTYYSKSINNCIYFNLNQWIGVNDENKILLLKVVNNQLTLVKTLGTLPAGVEITTLSIFDNNLWVGTKFQGLFKLFLNKNNTEKLVQFANDKIQGSIHKIAADSEKNIWIATAGGGLYQLVPTIFSYQGFGKKPVSILYKHEKTVIAFKDGFFVSEKSPSLLQNTEQLFYNSPYTISSITFLNDNELIVGTTQGIFIFNFITEVFSLIDSQKDSYCYKVDVLTNGEIAISTLNNGLYIYTNQLKEVKHYCLTTGFVSNNILDFKENPKDSSLWLNLGIDGLAEINKDNIVYWTKSKLLPKVQINDFCFSDQYVLLATVGKGVFKINTNTKEMMMFSNENELLSNFPTSISNINNTIWIGFNNGVQKINEYNYFDTYKKVDFADNTYIQKRGMYSVNNELILLGKKGLFFYNSNVDSVDKLVHKPQLIQLSVNQINKDFPPKKLQFNENNLSITFKSTNLKGKTLFYRYRLNGLEKQWNISNVYPNINYSNLASGRYSFDIQVSKDSHFNNIKKAGFSFSVIKPFWKKWWFMITQILVLFTIATVLFFFAKKSDNRKKIRFFSYVCIFILFEFIHELLEPYFIDSANEIIIIKIILNLLIALSLYPVETFIQRNFRK